MADCTNVEIRELLPERAGGALSAADVARIDAHLAECALCTEELALIHAARRTLRSSPAIDLARITSRVVAATTAPSRPQLVRSTSEAPVRPSPRLRWVGWKAAAAIAIAAAGIASFAVWESTDDTAPLPGAGTLAVAPAPRSPSIATTSAPAVARAPQPAAIAAAQPAELGVGGGLGDLSSNELQSLLGELRGSRIAAGDASFDEPETIGPQVGAVDGWESL